MHYSIELVREIAAKHGLRGEPEPLPARGMVNEAWQIGEAILRIIHQRDCDEEAEREAFVVPLVVRAGLKTPELLGYDLTCDLAPRPYTLYRKATGVLLAQSRYDPNELKHLYCELGSELAKLHRISVPNGERSLLDKSELSTPHKSLERALDSNAIGQADAREIGDWLDTLRPLIGGQPPPVLLHADIHPWNLFIDPDSGDLTSIIDWGDAGYGDPSLEFDWMPLQAVPSMLRGYQESGGQVDDGLVARSLWGGMSLALWEIRDGHLTGFERPWWRMPPGGWPELKDLVREHFPDFMA